MTTEINEIEILEPVLSDPELEKFVTDQLKQIRKSRQNMRRNHELKRGPYEFLTDNGLFTESRLIVEFRLILLKKSKLPSNVRIYIEMIVRSAINEYASIPEEKKEKQFIKCPECGSVELAEIKNTMPFPTFIHTCKKCNYIIQESEWEPLKALSIQQPWAWLITNGHKDIENRSTLKNIRGTYIIHAGKKFHGLTGTSDASPQEELAFKTCRGTFFDFDKGDDFEKGGIVGYATIVDCVHESDSPWFAGPNGLVLKDAQPLPFTPCKGAQGIFIPKID